jgi:hypothetical protein
MMGSRPVREPAELVIWSASSLLGVMVGIGTAFILWSQFRLVADQPIVDGTVVALAVGLSLIAVAVDNLTARLFMWAACATLAIAFFTAPGLFAAITG